MKTIAIAPSAITSKRRLVVELARRLRAEGHRVLLIERSDDAPDEGFERRVLDLRPPLDIEIGRPRVIAECRAVRAAAATFTPDALAGLLADIGADLLLVDIEEHECTIAALAGGTDVPVAVLDSFFGLWPRNGIGPLDSPLPPGTDPAGRARVALAWCRTWIRMRVSDLRRRLTSTRPDRFAVIRELARTTGVRRAMTRRQWLHPFVPRELPILQLTAAELDLPHTPPPNVIPVGPLLAHIDPATIEGLPDHALIASLDAARVAERPIVLCVSGAFMSASDGDFLDRIGQVAGRHPEALFVLGTGGSDLPAELAEAPNIHAVDWVPQREILSVADAAIVHSGTGTLHECVAAGVPMVVLPFRVNDQLGNAARVTHHGVGIVADRDDAPATIAAHLARVLRDDDMRARIDALRLKLERYERDAVAVRAVEGLLG